MNFPLSHIFSLCKYTGISFTACAISHEFFSGERAIWTAVFGIAIYQVGSALEKIAIPKIGHSWTDVLAIGIVAPIGLGFFTGGLQHFPDSPARSSWVVPAGFVMSLLAIYLIEGKVKIKGVIIYGSISLTLVITASLYALSYFNEHGSDGHRHDQGALAQVITSSMKEVRIEVDGTMRFSPTVWEVQAGEPIRIILVNKGKVDHELVIGTDKEIIAHVKEMVSPGAKGHHHTNEISTKPGQQADLVWTFKGPGICHGML
jgi:plastocyanin